MHINKKQRTILVCLIFPFIASLTGCASAPTGSSKDQDYATAFQPDSGKALIYIIRSFQYRGGGEDIQPYLDYNSLGSIGVKQYVVASVSPGKHTISGEAGEHTTIDAKHNAVYFFKIRVKGFMYMSHVIEQLAEAEGKELVKNYELAGVINNF